MTDAAAPHLPRQVQADPGAAALQRLLAQAGTPLWSGARLRVAQLAAPPALLAVLREAQAAGTLVRGMEGTERALIAEKHGLDLAAARAAGGDGAGTADSRRRTSTGRDSGIGTSDRPAPTARVSRLLLLSADGAERFYRRAETLLDHHAPRLLALRLSLDEATLGEAVFGPGEVARALLLVHKAPVSAALLALLPGPDGSHDATA